MTTHLLTSVAAFVQIAKHQSFTQAAAELGVSASALSQTIKGLEKELGVRLLNRTTRSVALTEQGMTFLEQASSGLNLIDHAFSTLEQQRDVPSGQLRVTMPRVVADNLVMPRLKEFNQRYPQICIELYIDRALNDLVGQGFDAGIRLGECLAKDMIALPITNKQRLVSVATQKYFKKYGIPKKPEDLLQHNCICYRNSVGRLMPWEFTRRGKDFVMAVRGNLIINNPEATVQLLLQDIGIAQVLEWGVRKEIESGRLVSVLEEWQPPFDGFYIYYPSREQLPPKLRVFIDFLRE